MKSAKNYGRRWYAAHREEINRTRRERFAAKPEEERERLRQRQRVISRRWYTNNRVAKILHGAKSHATARGHAAPNIAINDLALLVARETACQSCGRQPDVGRRLHLDHDHDTGAVRGLLCNNCNLALGHLGDDGERILRLAAYLERNRVGAA